ncbi:MAG TPA: SgcJ/EcaC family oxidoreductase [Isosphaeraceae bacterium]|nr:SgcJ/EcaC family oxidoreductase [Isosphaeraceae bacterium]
MRTTPVLIGALALAGTGLVVAASSPQQPGATVIEVQPAVPQQVVTPAPSQPMAITQPTAVAQPAAIAQPVATAQPTAMAQPASVFTPEQKAVAHAVETFAKIYSAADPKALADCFTDDIVLTDPEGDETRGKAAVTEMYAGSFQENPGLKLETQVAEVRFITPDVARVEGRSRLSGTGDASEFTRFSSLLVHKDGKWQAAEIREFTAPAEEISPGERLKELEWMVGHWVDESGNNRVEADVQWAENNSYLVRTYRAQMQGEKPTSGTQFIGWDPQTGQIKSWNFDSEGGHGEALWTRTSDTDWVVKAQGVLHDGRPTSATVIHTILNKDSVRTNSTERIIGGQVAPDIVDVVMVRKPPQPSVTAPAYRPAQAVEAPR